MTQSDSPGGHGGTPAQRAFVRAASTLGFLPLIAAAGIGVYHVALRSSALHAREWPLGTPSIAPARPLTAIGRRAPLSGQMA
jgi:hypothetical protein